jgi:hypothetical protein
MDEVSNGGFDEKPKVEISHKIKGWRCPKLFFPKPKQRTSPVNESTHAANN